MSEVKLRLIKEVPLFANLSEEEQQSIAERMQLEQYEEGEILYAKGDRGKALYLLESGWVKLTTDGRTVVTNLGAGSLLGEADMFLGRLRSTGASAASDVSVWVLAERDLTELIFERPELGLKLSLAFGARIDQLNEYLVQRRLKSLPFLADFHRQECSPWPTG